MEIIIQKYGIEWESIILYGCTHIYTENIIASMGMKITAVFMLVKDGYAY